MNKLGDINSANRRQPAWSRGLTWLLRIAFLSFLMLLAHCIYIVVLTSIEHRDEGNWRLISHVFTAIDAAYLHVALDDRPLSSSDSALFETRQWTFPDLLPYLADNFREYEPYMTEGGSLYGRRLIPSEWRDAKNNPVRVTIWCQPRKDDKNTLLIAFKIWTSGRNGVDEQGAGDDLVRHSAVKSLEKHKTMVEPIHSPTPDAAAPPSG